MTRRFDTQFHLAQHRRFASAYVGGIDASRMKGATRRQFCRIRRIALKPYALTAFLDERIGHGNRRKQGFGIRVTRTRIQRLHRSGLDDTSGVHDRHASADVFDDAQVMRDKDTGEMTLFPEFGEQVKNLCLYRHVERRHGFVRHDQFGVERQGPGNTDPLALAAAKSMGISPHVAGLETDGAQQCGNAVLQFAACGKTVDTQWFADYVTDGHTRVERRLRILKNHLNPSAKGFELGFGQRD